MIEVTLKFTLEMFLDENGVPLGITPELEEVGWAERLRHAFSSRELERLGVANIRPGSRKLYNAASHTKGHER